MDRRHWQAQDRGEFAKLADGQVVIRRNDGKLVRGGFQGHSTKLSANWATVRVRLQDINLLTPS